MKIRSGFVSNSSSSSFVAVFLRAPTLDELTQAYVDLWDETVIENMDSETVEALKSATPDRQKELIIGSLKIAEEGKDADARDGGCDSCASLNDCVSGIMKKDCHELGSFETGPDGGGSVYLTANEVRKILGDEPKGEDAWPFGDARSKAADQIIKDSLPEL